MHRNDQPLISIGIPTYNRAEGNLRLAITSALSQTYSNIEVIVSDNHSTDKTAEVVSQFKDERLVYVQQKKNIGPNNNFNYLVNRANGEYFILLPDDDLIDEDFVETCVKEKPKDKDVGIIHTGVRLIDGTGRIMRENPVKTKCNNFLDFVNGWFDGKFALYLCSTLFHTKTLQSIGGFNSPSNLFQDVVAEMVVASKLGTCQVASVKASFRRHDANLGSSVKVDPWVTDSLFLLDTICSVAPEHSNELRQKGLKFLNRLNFNRTHRIKSSLQRYPKYLTVAKKFNYAYPVFSYVWNLDLRPRLRELKNNILKR